MRFIEHKNFHFSFYYQHLRFILFDDIKMVFLEIENEIRIKRIMWNFYGKRIWTNYNWQLNAQIPCIYMEDVLTIQFHNFIWWITQLTFLWKSFFICIECWELVFWKTVYIKCRTHFLNNYTLKLNHPKQRRIFNGNDSWKFLIKTQTLAFPVSHKMQNEKNENEQRK